MTTPVKPFKKPKSFYVGVYDIDVEVFDSMELADRWLREEYVQTLMSGDSAQVADYVNGAQGFCAMVIKEEEDKQLKSVICICIPQNKHRGTLLAHESAHAAHMILDSRGVPMMMENTEVLAYLQDYVYKETAKALGMPT